MSTTVSIFRILGALTLGAFGVMWSFYSLIRLGLWRHGNRSLSFLHLDWILQPDLPYWGAHMSNLLHLAIGVGVTLWAFYRSYRTAREWWSAWRSTDQLEGAPTTVSSD